MPFAKKRNSNAVARKKDVVRITKRVLRAQSEKKAWSWEPLQSAATLTSWNVQSLICGTGAGQRLIQGSDFNERIGDKIRLHAIHFNVRIQPVAVMPEGNGNFCRFIVYHNKQANGAEPLATEIFTDDLVLALRNQIYRDRISVLKDFTHQMVVTGTNAGANLTSGPEFFGTFSIYPKQILSFNSSVGDIANLIKHDYGVAYAADTAACCVITVRAQVVFTDV